MEVLRSEIVAHDLRAPTLPTPPPLPTGQATTMSAHYRTQNEHVGVFTTHSQLHPDFSPAITKKSSGCLLFYNPRRMDLTKTPRLNTYSVLIWLRVDVFGMLNSQTRYAQVIHFMWRFFFRMKKKNRTYTKTN